MLIDILKSYLIGICAAAQLGPIAILVLQKTLHYGHRGGFTSALGSTLVDTTYAIISIFALAIVKEFVNVHQNILLICGGIILMGVGYSMAMRDPFRKMKEDGGAPAATWKDFVQASLTAISNPGAIFIMLALFTFFNVGDQPQDLRVAPLIIAVAMGSATWWFCFTWVFSRWRNSFKFRTLMWINRISGILIGIIGLALLAEGIYQIAF